MCLMQSASPWHALNGPRWVIIACGMSSQTSSFTRHSCNMVSGGGSTLSGNQYGPLPTLDGVLDGEYAGQSSVWIAFDIGKSSVRQIAKGDTLCHNLEEPCSKPLPIQDGASMHLSGLQYKSPGMITHGLSGYSGVVMSWCFCNTSVDGLEGSHTCLRQIFHSFDTLVPGCSPLCGWFQVVPISCRWRLNQRIFVWHIETSCIICIDQAALLKLVVLSLSMMVRPKEVILCWNWVILQCPAYKWLQTFRCVVWLNPTSENFPFWVSFMNFM